MAGKKGTTNNPHGRPKGSQNKDAKLAREAIARFVDGNAERLQGWLDEIAADSPEKAFNAFKDLLEYHVPKLARTELSGIDGGPVQTETVITFVKANKPTDTGSV